MKYKLKYKGKTKKENIILKRKLYRNKELYQLMIKQKHKRFKNQIIININFRHPYHYH